MKTVLNKAIARISAVILLGLFFVPCASSASVTLPPLDIHTLELPNGLHAVLVDCGDAPVITVEIWYHVGSRNEQPGKTGFAHVLEHMMFDGTRTIGRHFSDYIVRVGGIDNAYTTTDATVYWETMPTTNLPVALWLEADRMRNLDINQRALDNERRVIADERRRRYENSPYGNVIPTLYASAFTVSPYRHLPIGTVDDVDHATVQDIRDFYDTYYVPNNATVVIAGKFSIDDAERYIKRYFGPLKAGTRPISTAIPAEPPQTSQRIVNISRDVALPAFVEAFHIPADGTRDSFALRLASRILSGGDSGWIYHELVYEKQIALEAQSSADFSEDPNLFFVFAVMNSGYKLAEGQAAVAAILKRLQDNPLSSKVLERAKDQVLFELAADREKSKDLAEQLGYDAVILNNPQAINTEPAQFLAVTAEEVQAAARKYFVPQNMTLLEVHTGQADRTSLNLQAGGK